MSSATHFRSCIRRAKVTARGFWAWLPVARQPRQAQPQPAPALAAPADPVLRAYDAVIIRAAERTEPAR
jgi:hypothetical protein